MNPVSRENQTDYRRDSISELAKEFHYARVISPLFLDSAITASWIAGGECPGFSGKVRLRIDIGCVERNMAQPCPDGVEINSSTKQVGRCCVAPMYPET